MNARQPSTAQRPTALPNCFDPSVEHRKGEASPAAEGHP
jgi:hypothetical protein